MTVNAQESTTNPNIEPSIDINATQQKVDIKDTNDQNKQPVSDVGQIDTDPNWRAFREARKEDKERRVAAEARAQQKEAEAEALKAAMESVLSKGFPQHDVTQNSYAHEETEDERIEKKVQAAISARDAINKKERIEREKKELPEKLMKSFPDYYQVVNEENGAYLEYHHPEIYRSILSRIENFETCLDTYNLVKKYVPGAASAKRDAIKADNNFNKPKSISSTGITQPGEAMSASLVTQEKKAANWERMQRILKGVG